MRVLVVRLGAFGDIVHTLPLAADLAAAGHTVGWVCEDRWAPVLAGSPVVGAVHRLDRKALRGAAGLAGRLRALRRLRRELEGRYDLVIEAQGLAKSALIASLAGRLPRAAHARPRAREGSWLLPARRVPVVAEHVIDQQRALGLALGVRATGGWRFPLPAWTAERSAMAGWLDAHAIRRPWLLNVGAGWPTKVWPTQRLIACAAALREAGEDLVVVWGSPAERQIAAQVAAVHGHLAPPTTIPELGGLLAAGAVLISGDTGPLHLAHALGTPTVGLFGPVPAGRNGPRGRHAVNLQAPGAAWERHDVSKVDMAAITVEAVVAAARQAMAGGAVAG
jgi:heptosyltransferase-1